MVLLFFTDNSRTLLFPCNTWWSHAASRMEGSPKGGACTGKQQHGRKKRSANGALTRPVPRRKFLEHSHIRDRRITEMLLIVQGLPKIKTIMNKRQSPADREFRILGLCTCLFDVICCTKWRQHIHICWVRQTRRARCVHEKWSSDVSLCSLKHARDLLPRCSVKLGHRLQCPCGVELAQLIDMTRCASYDASAMPSLVLDN